MNSTKMRLAAASAPPDLLTVIRGMAEREGEGKGCE